MKPFLKSLLVSTRASIVMFLVSTFMIDAAALIFPGDNKIPFEYYLVTLPALALFAISTAFIRRDLYER